MLFHYAKSIYKKYKDLKLFTNLKRKNKVIIAFIFKIFPYIPLNLRNDYLKDLEKHIEFYDDGYKKLLSYFKKNWVNNKFFSFSEISEEEIFKRTNNIFESFHRTLNRTISHYHPKIGYLLIKLKEYINKSYTIFTESLIKNINNNIEKINIADDIYEFLKKYMNKIKSNIHIYNFIDNFETPKDINELFTKFLDLIYEEQENFFEIIYDNQNEENNNDTASEDEEVNEKYSEKELRLKLD